MTLEPAANPRVRPSIRSSSNRNELVIAASEVSKRFGSVAALTKVSIEVASGEVVALFGDNGAGKSTLIKCLAGVIKPDAGRVQTGVRGPPSGRVEVVYQDLALAPELSVLDNMFMGHEVTIGGLGGAVGILDRRRMRSIAHEALSGLELGLPSLDVRAGLLSGGERQVVAIARGVLWADGAIALDEPTSSLSPRRQRLVCGIIRQLANRGLGVLIASHDVSAVLEIADRVVVLVRGEVALDQSAATLDPATVAQAVLDLQPVA